MKNQRGLCVFFLIIFKFKKSAVSYILQSFHNIYNECSKLQIIKVNILNLVFLIFHFFTLQKDLFPIKLSRPVPKIKSKTWPHCWDLLNKMFLYILLVIYKYGVYVTKKLLHVSNAVIWYKNEKSGEKKIENWMILC